MNFRFLRIFGIDRLRYVDGYALLPWFSAMRFGVVRFRLLSLNGASVQDGVKGQHVGKLQCFAHLELPQRGGPALRVFSKPA